MENRRRSGSNGSGRQKGSTIIETTLVLLVFIFTMVGIADFATFLHLHQALTERVRGVARMAAIEGLTPQEIQTLVSYGVKSYSTDDVVKGYFGLSEANVGVQILDKGKTSQRLVVTITGLTYPLISPLLSGRGRNMPIRLSIPLEAA
jgi:Flp pilus assembly protein TadG